MQASTLLSGHKPGHLKLAQQNSTSGINSRINLSSEVVAYERIDCHNAYVSARPTRQIISEWGDQNRALERWFVQYRTTSCIIHTGGDMPRHEAL